MRQSKPQSKSSTRTMKSKSNRARFPRQLKFDSLEDRRLLAGLNVFVFDDTDGSGRAETDEIGTPGQVVFLDIDANGSIGVGEPWARTGLDGVARFEDLAAGDFFPTLLRHSKAAIQTSPVRSADHGRVLVDTSGSRLVGWDSDSSFWIAESNSFRKLDVDPKNAQPKLEAGGELLEYAVNPSTLEVVAIVRQESGSLGLKWFDLASGTSKPIEASQGGAWQQVVRTSTKFYALSGTGEQSSLFGIDSLARLKPVNGVSFGQETMLMANAQSSRLVVSKLASPFGNAEPIDTGGLRNVSVIEIQADNASKIVERSIPKELKPWGLTSDGLHLLIGTDAGATQVLNVDQGLKALITIANPLQGIRPESTGSGFVGFDSSASAIVRYDASNGTVSTLLAAATGTLPLGLAERPGAMVMAPWNRWLAAESPEGVYLHELGIPVVPPVRLAAGELSSISIGQRLIRDNIPPVLGRELVVDLLEDEVRTVGMNELNSGDVDGDSVAVFVVGGPQHGQIAWDPLRGGAYVPDSDFEGKDAFVVQAFDGRNWSEPRTIGIDIEAVNDVPSDLPITVESISEFASAGTTIGQVTVLDPDKDASYLISVSDPRLLVVDGALKIAQNSAFSFETEETLTFEIVATELNHPEDSIRRTIIVDVKDENDMPSDVRLAAVEVPELTPGAIVADVTVVDEDRNDAYRWFVSDGRFSIVDGKLKLATDTQLDFEAEQKIPLTITVIDGAGLGYSISRDFELQVLDRDDPSMGIILAGGTVIEKVRGFKVGAVTVQDDDRDEKFTFVVSDPRFEVARGFLRLKPTESVTLEDADKIPLTVTATSTTSGKSIQRGFQLNVYPNPTPWQNHDNPLDVNGDGDITPMDPLMIINVINRLGSFPLNANPPSEGEPGGGGFIDVNGDGEVSPIDVLIVINHLNQRSAGGSPNNGGNGNTGGGGTGNTPSGTGEGESLAYDELSMEFDQENRMSLAEYLSDIANREWGPRKNRRS